jgi:hypothetical protein
MLINSSSIGECAIAAHYLQSIIILEYWNLSKLKRVYLVGKYVK